MLFEGIRNFIDGVRPVTFDIGECVTQREIEKLVGLFALAYADGAFYGTYIKADTDNAIAILADVIASGRKLNVQVSKDVLGLVEAYYIGEGRFYQLLSPEQYEKMGCPSAAKPCLATGFGNKDEYNAESYAAYARAKQICKACFEKKGILERSPQEDPKSSETQESETVEENEDYIAPLDSKALKMYLGLSNEDLADKLMELKQATAAITGNREEYIKRLDMTEWARSASQEDYDRFVQAMKEQMDSLKGIIDNAREHMEYICQKLEDRKRAAENSTASDTQPAATSGESDATAAADTPSNDGSKPAPSDQKAVDGAATSADGEQTPAATPSGAPQAAPAPTSDKLGIPKKPSEETATPSAEEAETVFTPIEILDSVRKAGYSEDEIRNNKGFAELVQYETMYKALSATYGPDKAATIIAPLPDSSIPLSRARQILTDAGIQLN